MKIRTYILILIIAGLLLYIARDDVKTAYEHVQSYLDSKAGQSATVPAASGNQIAADTVAVSTSKAIDTPGALRVASEFLGLTPTPKLSAKDIIALTNEQRHDNGDVPPLTENATLDATAELKLQDMFAKQYFEHISPSGVGVQNQADQEGYQYILIGENLALGNFKSDLALIAAWMASPGHRANILNSKYADIGVAVGQGMFDGQETWLAVQHFGLQISACPAIDAVLNGVIQSQQGQISTMSADMAIRRQKIDSGAVYDGMSTNEQITAYNTLVEQYNTLVLDTKQKITTYNAEAVAFNTCVTNDTAGMTNTTE